MIYGVARLESGPRRWAVTRNGEVLWVMRHRTTAESQAAFLAEYLDIFGFESHRVRLVLSRVVS